VVEETTTNLVAISIIVMKNGTKPVLQQELDILVDGRGFPTVETFEMNIFKRIQSPLYRRHHIFLRSRWLEHDISLCPLQRWSEWEGWPWSGWSSSRMAQSVQETMAELGRRAILHKWNEGDL